MGLQMKSIRRYILESLKNITAYTTITGENIPTKYFRQHISSENFFFRRALSVCKIISFFSHKLATDGGITDERYTDEMLIACQKKNFLSKTVKCCSVLKPYLHGKTS